MRPTGGPHCFPGKRSPDGQTGDALWDAAQRSLLMHGELHNNVRMTWGKAILNWTPDAETALATMIDLNHRYALDGRDPASYGGILWCLGQFDRPFTPPRPIFGTVRWRSTTEHAKRLDADAYLRKTTRPLRDPMPEVAVIGAGISGLICARTLADHGFPVTVFEKSRGVGGRMATRRTADGLRFDHGAQYFTARDDRFRRYVESWMHDGVVKPWRGRIVVLDQGRVTEEKTSTRASRRSAWNERDLQAFSGESRCQVRNSSGTTHALVRISGKCRATLEQDWVRSTR